MTRVLMLALMAGCCFIAAFAQETGKNTATRAKQQTSHASGDEGGRLVEVHCGRCHRPPDQIPPSSAGSVVRHMRVRAMLSEEDQKAILKYLAP